ncbi:MAG: hypothetical protein Q9195_006681 [Heterodermia aff. obscurata]
MYRLAPAKTTKEDRLIDKVYKAVDAANDPTPFQGLGSTDRNRRSHAIEREHLRRFHDRNLLEDTAKKDSAWVAAGDGTRQRTISKKRMKVIRKMFSDRDWPNTDAGWEHYDGERSRALKDIYDARALRAFGDFNLMAYILDRSKPKDSKQVRVSSEVGAAEVEAGASSIERLQFNDSFHGALDDIEAGALVFNPSFKRALEPSSDSDSPLPANKRVKITDPLNSSPQARLLQANNEQGMALIKRMLGFKAPKEWTRTEFFASGRYAELRGLFEYVSSSTGPEERIRLQREGMHELEAIIVNLRASGGRSMGALLPKPDPSTAQKSVTPAQSSTHRALGPRLKLTFIPAQAKPTGPPQRELKPGQESVQQSSTHRTGGPEQSSSHEGAGPGPRSLVVRSRSSQSETTAEALPVQRDVKVSAHER